MNYKIDTVVCISRAQRIIELLQAINLVTVSGKNEEYASKLRDTLKEHLDYLNKAVGE